jgi:hypothetical protein
MGDVAFWGVIVGAILATVGGFTATRLEAIIGRRERERDSALLFGEILSVLELTTRLANQARGRGDPYGALTMRLVRAMRREADVYDRNRESLYDIRDGKLRAQIHALMVRMTLALDGIVDTTAEIAQSVSAVRLYSSDDPARAETMQRIEALQQWRQAAFDFAVETAGEALPIVASLRPLAKHNFDAYDAVVEGF